MDNVFQIIPKVKSSIRKRILLSFIILAILPLLLLGSVLSWQSYVIQQKQAEDLHREIMKRALNKISFLMHDLEEELRIAEKFNNLMEMDRAQQYNILSKLRSYKDEYYKDVINEIALMDSQGRELVRISRLEVFTQEDLRNRYKEALFSVPAKKGVIYYGPVHFDQLTGEPHMNISVPIYNIRTNELQGVIGSEIRLKFLWDLVAGISVGKSGTAYILDRDGRVIAHPNPSIVLRGTRSTPYHEYTGVGKGLFGTTVFLSEENISLGEQTLSLVVEIPVIEVFEKTFSTLITIAVFLILTLSGAVALGYIIIRKVVRPIESLSVTAGAISEGDLTQKTSVSSSDEIGALAGAFNTMTSKLITTIDSLKDSHERLLRVLDSLDSIVYVSDLKTNKILFINKHTRDTFGDIEGKVCWEGLQFGQAGPCSFCTNDKLLTDGGKPADVYQWEFQNSINKRWYYIHDRAIYWVDGSLARLEIATDITEKKKTEAILRNISEAATAEIGEAFFQSLTLILCRTLETEYAFVGKMLDHATVQTLAVCAAGKIVKNFQYDLSDTPCDQVVGKTLCSYPYNVQHHFPKDTLLVDMGIESYIGTPLFDSKKQPLGILVVMDKTPMKHEGLARSLLGIFAARTASEIERIKVEAMLTESEKKYRELMETAKDAIFIADAGTGILIDANKSAEELIGRTRDEIIGMHQNRLHPDGNTENYFHTFDEAAGSDQPVIEDRYVLHKDGRSVPVDISTNVVTSGDRKLVQGIYRDITERKIAEDQIKSSLKEKEVLIKEIHHRTKNNMQVISSLLNLQSELIKDQQYIELFNDSRNRIRSMALVHEKLYQSSDLTNIDFNDYVKNLSNGLLMSYDISPARISVAVSEHGMNLPIDTAIPCGLIINELISNSLKYAFPDGKAGKITITFNQTSIDGNSGYELKVSDNGIGIPDDIDIRKTRSLGLQLVTNLAEHQLQGEIALTRSHGTEFSIRFSKLKYKKRI